MRVKLKADYSLEFIDGTWNINENDDIVYGVEVELEVPTNSKERLQIAFQQGEIVEDLNVYTYKMKMYKQPDGTWQEMIPAPLLKMGGTWSFQIFRERLGSNNVVMEEKSSAVGVFTIGAGVKTGEGEKVTAAMLQTVWNNTEAAESHIQTMQAQVTRDSKAALQYRDEANGFRDEAEGFMEDAKDYKETAYIYSDTALKASVQAENAKIACEEIEESVKEEITVIGGYKDTAVNAQLSASASAESAETNAGVASNAALEAEIARGEAVSAKTEAVNAKTEAVLKADKVQEQYEKVMQVVGGIDNALTFATYSDAIEFFNTTDAEYAIGKTIYIVTKDVPDLWIAEIADSTAQYTYVSDTQFLEDMRASSGNMLHVGKYYLAESEGVKVYVSANIEDGYGKGGIQQVADNVKNGFDFTGKNAVAEEVDSSLSGIQPYGAVGAYSSAFGGKSSAQGKRSHAEGTTTIAKGKYSHAEGDNSVAGGDDSHAEGYKTYTRNDAQASHAEGYSTVTEGKYSHAEGQESVATGTYSHAEGYQTNAVGAGSHTGGRSTVANHDYQTVAGVFNDNKEHTLFEVGNGDGENERSNAFEVYKAGYVKVGRETTDADDDLVLATKGYARKYGGASNSNNSNIVNGEGVGSIKSSNKKDDDGTDYSTIVGYGENALPEASGHEAFAMGKGAKARGKRSFAFGSGALATGVTAVAIGQAVQATNNGALAFGNTTEASGEYSTATGQQTVAKGSRSFAGGWKNKANKAWSVAFGVENTVGSDGTDDGSGQAAFVAGMYNIVDGYVSTVFGTHNISKAQKQLIAGYKNTASKAFQTVFGYYNSNKENTLLEVGNGEDGKTSNAFEVYKNGTAKLSGTAVDEDDVTTVTDVKEIVKNLVGGIKSEQFTFIVKDANGVTSTVTKEILLK